jgi:hypothetical protein
MSNKDILGGFKGDTNSLITSSSASIPGGKYSANEITKLRYRGSWPIWSRDEGRGTYYPNAGTATTDFTAVLPQSTHVFVICAGGGGSGAADNDCQGQGPGGTGGFGKALISLSAVGSNVANITVGAGGAGVSGNDAEGNSGGLSRVTIGNFTITANGGGGGRSKNGGGAAGDSGNCTVSGSNLSFSTSSVFYSPLVQTFTSTADVVYQTVRTSVSGSGGACGGSSGNGTTGFVYLRWGGGINAATTLTPGKDPPGTGQDVPYTPSY